MKGKKLLLILLSFTLLILLTGCSGQLTDLFGGSGLGSITGTISYTGDVIGTTVWVIEENPENIEPGDATKIASTTISSSNGSYSIEDIAAGTYYVIAFKDVNGNETLDISDDEDIDGPIDPAGFYADTVDTESPVAVVVEEDETAVGIDFPIESAATTFTISGGIIDTEENPLNQAGVSVCIYGTAGVKVADDDTDSSGQFSISGLFPGTYYLLTDETTIPSGYLPTRSFYYLFDENVSGLYFPLVETQFAGSCGYDNGEPIVVGEVTDYNDTSLQGASVTLSPASGDKGYSDGSGGIDWTATTTDDDGMFFIKDADTNDAYTITANLSGYSFETLTLDLVADWVTYGKIFSD